MGARICRRRSASTSKSDCRRRARSRRETSPTPLDYAAVVSADQGVGREQSTSARSNALPKASRKLVLDEFGAPSVKVRVAKLAPLPGVRELGVQIERQRVGSQVALREQRGVAAGGGRVDGQRALDGEAEQVVRTARLGPGARTDPRRRTAARRRRRRSCCGSRRRCRRARADDAVDRRVDAAVDAEREPVAERVDRVDRARRSRRRETSRHVQIPGRTPRASAARGCRATISVGATNVPCAHAAGSATRCTDAALPRASRRRSVSSVVARRRRSPGRRRSRAFAGIADDELVHRAVDHAR
mgnify:CR=1 FL=1